MDDFEKLCGNLGYKKINFEKGSVQKNAFANSGKSNNLNLQPSQISFKEETEKIYSKYRSFSPISINRHDVFVRNDDERLDEFLKRNTKSSEKIKPSFLSCNYSRVFSSSMNGGLNQTRCYEDRNFPIKNHEYSSKKNRNKKIFQNNRYKRQQYDDTLDLHGLQISEAFDILMLFIRKNFIANKRLLLVVTGLGDVNNPYTIKNNVNRWMQGRNDLQKMISRFNHPDRCEGGEGAFCLYLRKYEDF